MEQMPFIKNDGGRATAGFKGNAGDCVARAVAIASNRPYAEVYAALAKGTGAQRAGKCGKRRASARNGINTTRKWFKDYMASLGFVWVPTMTIGSGCKVHLAKGELPMGRLVVSLSKHMAAVIDGAIHDTHDPSRWGGVLEADGQWRTTARCVYGYWLLPAREALS